MNEKNIFLNQKQSKLKKIWFYLTCLRPITKYEMFALKAQMVVILEGIRESDLQHYRTESAIINEFKKLVEDGTFVSNKKRTSDNKNDISHMYD
jgi:hypothetical protein